jgi:hypothetical protein
MREPLVKAATLLEHGNRFKKKRLRNASIRAQIIEKGLCGGRAVSKGRSRQKKAEDVSVRVSLNIYLA